MLEKIYRSRPMCMHACTHARVYEVVFQCMQAEQVSLTVSKHSTRDCPWDMLIAINRPGPRPSVNVSD